MADNEQKALNLIAEAEKKLTTQKGFFGSLFRCVFATVPFWVFFAFQLAREL